MVEGFLLGIVASQSLIAGLIFLRFWRDTRDSFFLAFASAFTIEGLNRFAYLFLDRPNEGAPWIYLVRLFAFVLILIAILRKNYGSN
jgi:uncharacterized membrane protein